MPLWCPPAIYSRHCEEHCSQTVHSMEPANKTVLIISQEHILSYPFFKDHGWNSFRQWLRKVASPVQLPLVGRGNLNKQGHRGIAPEHRKCHGKLFARKTLAIPLARSLKKETQLFQSANLHHLKNHVTRGDASTSANTHVTCLVGHHPASLKHQWRRLGSPTSSDFQAWNCQSRFCGRCSWKISPAHPTPARYAENVGRLQRQTWIHHIIRMQRKHTRTSVQWCFSFHTCIDRWLMLLDVGVFFPTAGQIWWMESHFGFAVPRARWKTTLLTRQATLYGTVETWDFTVSCRILANQAWNSSSFSPLSCPS